MLHQLKLKFLVALRRVSSPDSTFPSRTRFAQHQTVLKMSQAYVTFQLLDSFCGFCFNISDFKHFDAHKCIICHVNVRQNVPF